MNEKTNIESGATNIADAGTVRVVTRANTTPGWQTSEFWMTALGQAGLVLATAGGFLPAKYAALAAAASQVAYSLSRGLSKGGTATPAALAR